MIGKLKYLFAICLLLVTVNCKDELSKANNAFAVDLYKEIGEANSGENVFFSPISISTAFAMVSLGANGTTKEQIKNVLHLNQLSSDNEVKEAYKQLLMSFENQTNDYILSFVSRLFGSKVFQFRPAFLQDLQTYFEASLESLDFVNKSDESRVQINDWVAEETHQKITNLLPAGSITPNTKLVLVNAIYFNASWVSPFDKALTASGLFRIPNSTPANMSMMHVNDKFFNYYNSTRLRCEVIELPYHGNKASMFIALPYDVDGLPNVEKQLSVNLFAQGLKKLQSRNMNVQLPKFVIEQSVSLKSQLEKLGMEDAFDETRADLSGIGGPDRLVVTDAIHKAFVNVTESGTEAAAATGVVVGVTSVGPPPIQFTVDRPFFFLIYEKSTKTVLFIGRFVRPSE